MGNVVTVEKISVGKIRRYRNEDSNDEVNEHLSRYPSGQKWMYQSIPARAGFDGSQDRYERHGDDEKL
jgi:hypothetical protein